MFVVHIRSLIELSMFYIRYHFLHKWNAKQAQNWARDWMNNFSHPSVLIKLGRTLAFLKFASINEPPSNYFILHHVAWIIFIALIANIIQNPLPALCHFHPPSIKPPLLWHHHYLQNDWVLWLLAALLHKCKQQQLLPLQHCHHYHYLHKGRPLGRDRTSKLNIAPSALPHP